MSAITANDLLPLLSGEVRTRRDSAGHMRYISPCPICGGTDRFMITDMGDHILWWCRQAHEQPAHYGSVNGKPLGHGQYWFGDNLYEIITGRKWNAGNYTPSERRKVKRVVPPPPAFDKMAKSVKLSPEFAFRLHRTGRNQAIRYFGERSINENSVDRHALGYVTEPKQCDLPAGFTIPNFSVGPNGDVVLRGIDVRRDDAYCINLINRWPTTQYAALQRRIYNDWKRQVVAGVMPAEALHRPTEQEMIARQWSKYKGMTTGQNGIWGDDLVTLPDKSRIGPTLPFICMVESANDAILLRQLGYPAVAYKPRKDWDFWLPTVFRQVRIVILIADQDSAYNNRGAGEFRAHYLMDAITKGKLSFATIVTPPDGVKDPGELAQKAGLDAVDSWLRSISSNVQPILLDEAASPAV